MKGKKVRPILFILCLVSRLWLKKDNFFKKCTCLLKKSKLCTLFLNNNLNYALVKKGKKLLLKLKRLKLFQVITLEHRATDNYNRLIVLS